MSEPAHTLLVVPSDDLRGMLDGGACGFRPPVMDEILDNPWHKPNGWYPGRTGLRAQRRALVLRWKGEDMPHGWLAAALSTDPLIVTIDNEMRERVMRRLREAGCTLIALDKQGKDLEEG
jgi:hypothetical protein